MTTQKEADKAMTDTPDVFYYLRLETDIRVKEKSSYITLMTVYEALLHIVEQARRMDVNYPEDSQELASEIVKIARFILLPQLESPEIAPPENIKLLVDSLDSELEQRRMREEIHKAHNKTTQAYGHTEMTHQLADKLGDWAHQEYNVFCNPHTRGLCFYSELPEGIRDTLTEADFAELGMEWPYDPTDIEWGWEC